MGLGIEVIKQSAVAHGKGDVKRGYNPKKTSLPRSCLYRKLRVRVSYLL